VCMAVEVLLQPLWLRKDKWKSHMHVVIQSECFVTAASRCGDLILSGDRIARRGRVWLKRNMVVALDFNMHSCILDTGCVYARNERSYAASIGEWEAIETVQPIEV
jgi:hypothetical protein